MVGFNKAIENGTDPISISGDIGNKSIFDLKGKTVNSLTIDLTGMKKGDSITLKNGEVQNLKVIDKEGVKLIVKDVEVSKQTKIN